MGLARARGSFISVQRTPHQPPLAAAAVAAVRGRSPGPIGSLGLSRLQQLDHFPGKSTNKRQCSQASGSHICTLYRKRRHLLSLWLCWESGQAEPRGPLAPADRPPSVALIPAPPPRPVVYLLILNKTAGKCTEVKVVPPPATSISACVTAGFPAEQRVRVQSRASLCRVVPLSWCPGHCGLRVSALPVSVRSASPVGGHLLHFSVCPSPPNRVTAVPRDKEVVTRFLVSLTLTSWERIDPSGGCLCLHFHLVYAELKPEAQPSSETCLGPPLYKWGSRMWAPCHVTSPTWPPRGRGR